MSLEWQLNHVEAVPDKDCVLSIDSFVSGGVVYRMRGRPFLLVLSSPDQGNAALEVSGAELSGVRKKRSLQRAPFDVRG